MKILQGRERRTKRVREAIKRGRRKRRLSVFRSNQYTYGQIVDLTTGKTLLTISSREFEKKKKNLTKKEAAFLAGEKLGKEAVKLGIKRVVFDRNGYQYHGRVRAFAEGARQGGLKF